MSFPIQSMGININIPSSPWWIAGVFERRAFDDRGEIPEARMSITGLGVLKAYVSS